MAFSIEELGKIDHIVGDWCIQRVPPAIKGKLDHDFEIEGQAVTLLEVRPLWRGKQGDVGKHKASVIANKGFAETLEVQGGDARLSPNNGLVAECLKPAEEDLYLELDKYRPKRAKAEKSLAKTIYYSYLN